MNSEDFKSAGKHSPSPDFTSQLMQSLQREDQALESLLRQHGKMETSEAFVAALQAQLEGVRVKKTYQPLFTAKSWALVAFITLGLFALPFLMGTSGSDSGMSFDLSEYGDYAKGLFQHSTIPYFVLPSLILFMFGFARYSGRIRA